MNLPCQGSKEEITERELRAALRHFSPTTFQAARDYRRSGDPVHLPCFLIGVLEHYSAPEKRPELCNARHNLRLAEDLGLDSLTRMELAILLEEVLQTKVGEEQLSEIETLGEMLKFTEQAVSRSPAG
jgi:3-hydroxyacyl-[acyl-carrier-protein] dehydratase